MDFEHDARAVASDPDEISGWRIALETMWERIGSAFPQRDDFLHFARCFSSSEQFSTFIPLDEDANQIEELLKAVDASDYSLKEWVGTLVILDVWLKGENRDFNMQKCIGYIACCAESASISTPLASLEDFTTEMITTHGID